MMMPDYSLVQVEHQPDFDDHSLIPVDHDPFAADGPAQQAQIQQPPTPAQPTQVSPPGDRLDALRKPIIGSA
jgi:hypothetical protein